MSTAIRIIAIASGLPCPEKGEYIKSVDFEHDEGRGKIVTTKDPTNALKFSSAQLALNFYTTQSQTVPIRPDGKPNRPLTAYSVEIVKLPDIEGRSGRLCGCGYFHEASERCGPLG